MQLWTTFAPRKIVWELTTIQTKEKGATSNWIEHTDLVETSLKKLKHAGIVGMRLVIFPTELTQDGKKFDWKPIETMLELCKKQKLLVDLCIGPYQFPHYPGIYLPNELLKHVFDNPRSLDTTPSIYDYGMRFLEQLIIRYGDDKRVHGFHFANEWPDRQAVSGKEKIHATVSHNFMIQAATFLKKNTTKPISLNTNIDATDKKNIKQTFGELLTILDEQGKLGFDIYPSQETWKKVPLIKLKRLFQSYAGSIKWLRKNLSPCEIYFAEVEAQPWGNGQSWYRLIKKENDPNEKVITYTKSSLKQLCKKYITKSQCSIVSLWGSDFWLSADAMGINWPLNSVKMLSKKKH